MIGSIWEGVNSQGHSSLSIQFIKRAVQDFVRNLEQKEEGIQDQIEYDAVIGSDLKYLYRQKKSIRNIYRENRTIAPRGEINYPMNAYKATLRGWANAKRWTLLRNLNRNLNLTPVFFESLNPK